MRCKIFVVKFQGRLAYLSTSKTVEFNDDNYFYWFRQPV